MPISLRKLHFPLILNLSAWVWALSRIVVCTSLWEAARALYRRVLAGGVIAVVVFHALEVPESKHIAHQRANKRTAREFGILCAPAPPHQKRMAPSPCHLLAAFLKVIQGKAALVRGAHGSCPCRSCSSHRRSHPEQALHAASREKSETCRFSLVWLMIGSQKSPKIRGREEGVARGGTLWHDGQPSKPKQVSRG